MRSLRLLIVLALPFFLWAKGFPRITIIKWTSEIKAYNETLAGVLDGLKAFRVNIHGIRDGLSIYDCSGSRKACAEIVEKTLPLTDIFVTLGTVPTKEVMRVERNKPILFSIVGAPKASGIVDSFNRPGKNVTGVSMKIPLEYEVEAIKDIVNPRTIAIPYFHTYPQGVATAKEAKLAAERMGIGVKEIVFMKENRGIDNFKEFLERELHGADAVYLPTCPVIYKPHYLSAAIETALSLGIPVFGITRSAVLRGALMSITCDFYRIGYNLGPYVKMVVDGEFPGNLPVQTPTAWRIYVNLTTASRLGIKIPKSYIIAAEEIVR